MTNQAEPIVAIDILLEPDARMVARAEANNARLRQAFPPGFALDAAHRPHITLLQAFVAARDLDAVYAAVDAAIVRADVTTMTLDADRCYYAPAQGVGIAGICIVPTSALTKLQAAVIAAAAPYMQPTATIAAFTAPHDDPAFDAAMIDYVSGFVAHYAGAKFNPHASTGVASRDYLDAMLAEPFEAFAFAPAGAAVYQLGPFGTAARLLHRTELAA